MFVAGIGFWTDAYDIFAINLVLPMLAHVYWDGNIPISTEIAMKSATLIGCMIGQVGVGFLADIYGRRKMYGVELLIVISATIGFAMCSTGEAHSMSIFAWMVFWRLFMGIGIGADYPLSAVITAEFAPTKYRARMMTIVFWQQALGQLVATLVTLAATRCFRSHIPGDAIKTCNDECKGAIDALWRLVVGVGAIPAVVALGFRLTIPESPRYTLDVSKDSLQARSDVQDYFGDDEDLEEVFGFTAHDQLGEHEDMSMVVQRLPEQSCDDAMDHQREGGGTANSSPNPTNSYLAVTENGASQASPDPSTMAASHTSHAMDNTAGGQSTQSSPLPTYLQTPSLSHDAHSSFTHPTSIQDSNNALQNNMPLGPREVPPSEPTIDPRIPKNFQAFSKVDLIHCFITQGKWKYLAGTSLSWLVLDFAFYGLGMNSPDIIDKIWEVGAEAYSSIYDQLIQVAARSLVVVSVGAVTGGLLMIKLVDYWGCRKVQLWGFVVLGVLFIILGSVFGPLLGNQFHGVIVTLYVACLLFFNLGKRTHSYPIVRTSAFCYINVLNI